MWKRLAVLFLPLMILQGCERLKLPFSTPSPSPTPSPTPEPIPTPFARLAPEGVYYIIKPTSIFHDSGVLGLPIGTEVRLVKEVGDTAMISYEGHSIEVALTSITRDLDVLDAKVREDQENHRRAREFAEQQLEEARAQSLTKMISEVSKPKPDRLEQINKEIALIHVELERLNYSQMQSSVPSASIRKRRKELEKKIFELQQEARRIRIVGDSRY